MGSDRVNPRTPWPNHCVRPFDGRTVVVRADRALTHGPSVATGDVNRNGCQCASGWAIVPGQPADANPGAPHPPGRGRAAVVPVEAGRLRTDCDAHARTLARLHNVTTMSVRRPLPAGAGHMSDQRRGKSDSSPKVRWLLVGSGSSAASTAIAWSPWGMTSAASPIWLLR
jgi:hypothetical protein